MTAPKKKAPRAKTPQQNLEAGVGAVTRSITALVKLIERNGEKLTAEDVGKAFSFIGVANGAGQTKALAAVQAAALTNFSLDKAIPAFAGMQIAPAPVFPSTAITPAPAPAGTRTPSVQELGGRFCKDARDARARVPGDDRGLAAPQDDEEPTFLDEDETDPDIETE